MFCDCDFVWQIPSHELVKYCDPSKAVVCVQHDYKPKEGTKMDGQVQTVYPRKNWSSMVLWNCEHPKNKLLTPELLNEKDGIRNQPMANQKYYTTQRAVHGLMDTESANMPMCGKKN